MKVLRYLRSIKYSLVSVFVRLFIFRWSSVSHKAKFRGIPKFHKPYQRVTIKNGASIGKCVYFLCNGSGEITIGRNTSINDYTFITSLSEIRIGSDTLIAERVSIRDYDHRFDQKHLPIAKQGYTSAPISIGNNCWIGAGVVILKGVTIGDNCVIGANAVVNKAIPCGSIAVGVPAKVIKTA